MTSTDDQPPTGVDGSPDDDRALLRRIAAADQAALEALYDRFSSMAYAVALRITADTALAEDVVQEAFVAAWRNAGRYDDSRGSVKTWLLSIAHHRAIDVVRQRRATSPLPEEGTPPPAELTVPDLWAEVAGRLDADVVRRALATLSAVQREALELAYYRGLTQEEIAARTGAPLGTVKGRMRLGLQALRSVLTAAGAGAEGRGVATAPARRPETDR